MSGVVVQTSDDDLSEQQKLTETETDCVKSLLWVLLGCV